MNLVNARTYIANFTNELTDLYGQDEAKALAQYLCVEFLQMKPHQLSIIERLLDPGEQQRFDEVKAGLLQGKPIQQILRYAWFCGLKFSVNEHVLIPRPETEEMVEMIIADCRNRNIKAPRIIDLGTGSGCIPVSLKKNLPNASVFAVEIMPEALRVAKENAQMHKADIRFWLGDMSANDWIQQAGKIPGNTVLVSNPPYIAKFEADAMHRNVMAYEPHTALFVPDDDVLRYYKVVAAAIPQLLQGGDRVWLEINPLFAHETLALFESKGYAYAKLVADMSDKLRFINVGI